MDRSPRKIRFLPVLALALVALAAFVASGCGGDDSGSDVPPQQRVDTALKNAGNIKSGQSTLDATIALGGLPGSLKLKGGGPFDTEAEGGAAFDIEVTVNIAGLDQTVGFLAVDGKTYLKYGDKTFANDKKDANTNAINPTQIRGFFETLPEYISNVKATGTKTVNGQKLDMYSMTIDLKGLSEGATGSAKAVNQALPGLGSFSDLVKSFNKADATLGIGSDDFPHEIGLNATPESSSGNGGGIRGTLVLTDINQPVNIEKPTNVVENESALDALGGLLGGTSGGQ